MKKTFFLLVASILTSYTTVNAQSFHKRAVVVDFGAGINISQTEIKQQYNRQVWNGSGFTIMPVKKDTTDISGAFVFPLTVEYGLKNWLGVGGKIGYAKYFTSNDSLGNAESDVRGLDAGILLNFHFIKISKFDLPLGVTFAYSNFKMISNDSLQTIAKDNGFNYSFSANPRFYFGNHIGVSVNLGYTVYTYPSLLFSDKNDSNLNDNDDMKFKLKSSGGNIGVGLLVKF
ncbi:MAG: outer membrane beta-barrel protein [Bacteroidia bacterium]